MNTNPVVEAVEILGGYTATGRICGVSYKSVSKWCKRGKLPRTEATGETGYAKKMAAADSRISLEKLLNTVSIKGKEAA